MVTNEKREVMKLVRLLCPGAPEVGQRVRVYFGFYRGETGYHGCTPRSPRDVSRRATVLGYSICLADCCEEVPRTADTVHVYAKVRPARPVPGFLGRYETVNVLCLDV